MTELLGYPQGRPLLELSSKLLGSVTLAFNTPTAVPFTAATWDDLRAFDPESSTKARIRVAGRYRAVCWASETGVLQELANLRHVTINRYSADGTLQERVAKCTNQQIFNTTDSWCSGEFVAQAGDYLQTEYSWSGSSGTRTVSTYFTLEATSDEPRADGPTGYPAGHGAVPRDSTHVSKLTSQSFSVNSVDPLVWSRIDWDDLGMWQPERFTNRLCVAKSGLYRVTSYVKQDASGNNTIQRWTEIQRLGPDGSLLELLGRKGSWEGATFGPQHSLSGMAYFTAGEFVSTNWIFGGASGTRTVTFAHSCVEFVR